MEEKKKGFFARLVSGLNKTRENIVSSMDSIFSGFSAIDDDFYEELEETLIMGDMGIQTTVILGFNTKSEIFYEEQFKELGCEVIVTTVDGSYGVKGFVTNALPETYTYFYTCGPEPMLKAVYRATNTSGQMSFEERMGCGFGACMGCSCKTLTGYKRICKEGPVMKKEEILWEA